MKGTETVVVVMPEVARGGDWVDALRGDHREVLWCAGPRQGCPLLSGHALCELLERADLAVYDVDGVSVSFLARLFRAYPELDIRVCRDDCLRDGRHRPAMVARVGHHGALA